MLFNDNLETKIFNVHQYLNCDELNIISGYVGPSPVQRLSTLPFETKVIYGMFGSQSISYSLHNTLMNLHNPPRNEILYSIIPVHSKCYIWKNKGQIVYALVGSANFSTKGLNIPFKETLAETTTDTFSELNTYLNQILSNSIACDTVSIERNKNLIQNPKSCNMILYNPVNGEVPNASGLNWGHSVKGHNKPGDAYITIRTSHIRAFPNLFPPKQTKPTNLLDGKPNRQNDYIELIWDDGTIMKALLEGTQPVDGFRYPKQLCSFPNKSDLGHYLRKRMGLGPSHFVTKDDLNRYGRDNITVTLLQEGTYYMDFSI